MKLCFITKGGTKVVLGTLDNHVPRKKLKDWLKFYVKNFERHWVEL